MNSSRIAHSDTGVQAEPPGPGLDVPCPRCAAPSGELCRTRAGRACPVHAPRRKASQILASFPDDLICDITRYLCDLITWADADEPFLCALWILHTWKLHSVAAVNRKVTSVFLIFLSHDPDAGKTERMAALESLSFGALRGSFTAAALTRFLDAGGRAMFLDQMHNVDKAKSTDRETFYQYHADGYQSGAAHSMAGENGKMETRKTFFARCFAGLTQWKIRDEIRSRSFVIMCARGTEADQDDRETRQAQRPPEAEAARIGARIAEWASQPGLTAQLASATRVKETRTLNDGRVLSNRDSDNFRFLFAIADSFSDVHGKRIREIAARELDCTADDEPAAGEDERIDQELLSLARTGRLPVHGYKQPGSDPLGRFIKDARALLAVTDSDLGWTRQRYARDPLPAVSLVVSIAEKRAELRIPAKALREITQAFASHHDPASVKAAYKAAAGHGTDGKRLRHEAGRNDVRSAMYAGASRETRVIAIDWTPVIFGKDS